MAEKEYIEREAAIGSLLGWAAQLTETYGKNDEYVKCLESAAYNIEQIPAADVRPVVLCGVCELHGHCYTEDVFAFTRLAEENRFCAVGKVKKNGKKREES